MRNTGNNVNCISKDHFPYNIFNKIKLILLKYRKENIDYTLYLPTDNKVKSNEQIRKEFEMALDLLETDEDAVSKTKTLEDIERDDKSYNMHQNIENKNHDIIVEIAKGKYIPSIDDEICNYNSPEFLSFFSFIKAKNIIETLSNLYSACYNELSKDDNSAITNFINSIINCTLNDQNDTSINSIINKLRAMDQEKIIKKQNETIDTLIADIDRYRNYIQLYNRAYDEYYYLLEVVKYNYSNIIENGLEYNANIGDTSLAEYKTYSTFLKKQGLNTIKDVARLTKEQIHSLLGSAIRYNRMYDYFVNNHLVAIWILDEPRKHTFFMESDDVIRKYDYIKNRFDWNEN